MFFPQQTAEYNLVNAVRNGYDDESSPRRSALQPRWLQQIKQVHHFTQGNDLMQAMAFVEMPK